MPITVVRTQFRDDKIFMHLKQLTTIWKQQSETYKAWPWLYRSTLVAACAANKILRLHAEGDRKRTWKNKVPRQYSDYISLPFGQNKYNSVQTTGIKIFTYEKALNARAQKDIYTMHLISTDLISCEETVLMSLMFPCACLQCFSNDWWTIPIFFFNGASTYPNER